MQKPYRRHKTSAKISALRSLLTYNYMNTRFQTKAYISNSKFQIQTIFQELFKPKHLYSKDYFRLHENISNQIFFKPKTQEHNISKYISNFQLHTPANAQTYPKPILKPTLNPLTHGQTTTYITKSRLLFSNSNQNQQASKPNHKIKQKIETNQERNSKCTHTSKTHFETNPKSLDSWPNNHIHTQNPLVFPDPNRNQQVLEPNHRIKQKLKTKQERNNSLKEHDEQFKRMKFELGKIKLISPANLNPEKSKP